MLKLTKAYDPRTGEPAKVIGYVADKREANRVAKLNVGDDAKRTTSGLLTGWTGDEATVWIEEV